MISIKLYSAVLLKINYLNCRHNVTSILVYLNIHVLGTRIRMKGKDDITCECNLNNNQCYSIVHSIIMMLSYYLNRLFSRQQAVAQADE